MLIVVRHGRTRANAEGLLLGRRVDPDLDDVGRVQAAALGTRLSGAHRVVCSPLRRTRQTAAALGLPVEVDDRWAELDYGDLDGTPIAGISSEEWRRWRSDLDHRPPGGESIAELGARVRAACADLAGEAAERDVVVVTHVSPVKAAVAWALGVDDSVAWRMFVTHGAICRIAVGDRGPALHAFNLTAHLEASE